MLGWDITDYGLGDFEKVGFALITLRNGNQHNPKYKKVYAEKLLMLKEGQHSPMHFHWVKSEDIITSAPVLSAKRKPSSSPPAPQKLATRETILSSL